MAKVPKIMVALRLSGGTVEKVRRWADQLSTSQADVVEQAVELFDTISSAPFKSESLPAPRGEVTLRVPVPVTRGVIRGPLLKPSEKKR